MRMSPRKPLVGRADEGNWPLPVSTKLHSGTKIYDCR